MIIIAKILLVFLTILLFCLLLWFCLAFAAALQWTIQSKVPPSNLTPRQKEVYELESCLLICLPFLLLIAAIIGISKF